MHVRFLYSRKADHGVSVGCPAENCISAMVHGGFWDLMLRGFVDEQVHRQVLGGISESDAVRFAKAIAFGGLTQAEAYEVICGRDCNHLGYNIDIVSASDIPSDRWFRNAWKRSPNGGPVSIDLEKAKPIHWDRLMVAVTAENDQREKAYERRPLIKPAWETIRGAVRHARDADELRKIWPDGMEQVKL
ncbi:MAG: hypothetical protein EBR82_36625 [Caulobacteraceae bacterium]|nr:hypothetical protein [Caulobacteraceae bacterium]